MSWIQIKWGKGFNHGALNYAFRLVDNKYNAQLTRPAQPPKLVGYFCLGNETKIEFIFTTPDASVSFLRQSLKVHHWF